MVATQEDENNITVKQVETLGGEVPGAQTVPRAELWGAIMVIARAPDHFTITIGIDASYVVNGWLRRRKLAKRL